MSDPGNLTTECTGFFQFGDFNLNLDSIEGRSFLAIEKALKISFNSIIRPPQETDIDETEASDELIDIEGWNPRKYALELYRGIISLGFTVTEKGRNYLADSIGQTIAINYHDYGQFPTSIIVEKTLVDDYATFINVWSIDPNRFGSQDASYSLHALIPANHIERKHIQIKSPFEPQALM